MEEHTNSDSFFSATQARNLALKKQEELKNRQYFIKAFKNLKFVENSIINSASAGKLSVHIPYDEFHFENEKDYLIFCEIFYKNMKANGYSSMIKKNEQDEKVYFKIYW